MIKIEDVLQALDALQRDSTTPNRLNFSNKFLCDSKTSHKLILLAFIMNKKRGTLLREIASDAISLYEKENGNLIKNVQEVLNGRENT